MYEQDTGDIPLITEWSVVRNPFLCFQMLDYMNWLTNFSMRLLLLIWKYRLFVLCNIMAYCIVLFRFVVTKWQYSKVLIVIFYGRMNVENEKKLKPAVWSLMNSL